MKCMIKFLTILFILNIQIKGAFPQEYYIAESFFINDITTCDIDLDNDIDVIVGSNYDGVIPDTIYIFYNDGLGILSNTAIARTNRIQMRCGNIDIDMFPDIVTSGNGNILFIHNNGDGTFGEEIPIASSENYRIIEYIRDMDGDGLNDLVYTYSNIYMKWGILKNEGELIFTDHIIYDNGIGGSLSPYIGNLNNDDLPDVCLSFIQLKTHYLINRGNLIFDTTLLCPVGWNTTPIMKLNTISPDDIAVFHNNSDQLFLFENLNNEEILSKDTLPLIGPVMVTDFADFNNDGYDDYCYALCYWTGCTDSLYVSINDQHWNFYPPQQYYIGPMEIFRTEVADINGDDFKDIVLYGYLPRNAFKILWNDGFGGFSYENPVGIDESFKDSCKLEVQIKPNPFESIVNISLKSELNFRINISILDILGRRVREIESMSKQSGEKLEIEWDGRDSSGNEVIDGFYFISISYGYNNQLTYKIIKY